MTSVHSPDDTRIFLKECTTLVAAGYEVHLVAPGAVDGISNGVRRWGVPPPRSGSRAERMTCTVLRVCRVARSLQPDLYHFHDPEIAPAALLLARGGKPVIYDVHEDLAAAVADKDWLPARLRPLVARAACLEPAIVEGLAGAATATPAISERFAGSRRPVVTVNNYPRLEEFQPVPGPGTGEERIVCYVGGITALRGGTTMIEAIAKTGVRLLLAGSIDPPELRDQLRAMPGWSLVEELGHVGRSQVGEVLNRALAGLVVYHPAANHLRAQPTKLFEYMSAGLAVVASDFPLWREIVDAAECGMCVDPFDASALAGAITWMVTHPAEARKMGENGRRAVETRYNWDVEARKLLALYETVLGRCP